MGPPCWMRWALESEPSCAELVRPPADQHSGSGHSLSLVLGSMSRKENCASEFRPGAGHSGFPLTSCPLSQEGRGKSCFLPTDIQGVGGQGRLPRGGDKGGGWPFFPTGATQSGLAGITQGLPPRDTRPWGQRGAFESNSLSYLR